MGKRDEKSAAINKLRSQKCFDLRNENELHMDKRFQSLSTSNFCLFFYIVTAQSTAE